MSDRIAVLIPLRKRDHHDDWNVEWLAHEAAKKAAATRGRVVVEQWTDRSEVLEVIDPSQPSVRCAWYGYDTVALS